MSQTETRPAGPGVSDDDGGVGERIEEFFAERIAVARSYGSDYQRLWEAARTASRGGKRLRPALVIGVHRQLDGRHDRAAVEVAVGFELLHTAFLLHDDVIDHDELRRGVPNLAAGFRADARARGVREERAGQWGQSAAILAGDLLIHYAQSLVARLDLDPDAREALLDVFERSVFVTAAGELADVSFGVGVGDARLPDVLAMTERKTATYSFEAPLTAGAILAGADRDTRQVLAEFGSLLGVAFQLGDDLLGVFGSEGVTGKSVLTDLREAKETPLIAHARSTASWPAIEELLGKPDLSDLEAAVVRLALEACGSRAFVESLVVDYTVAAIDLLERSALPAGLAEDLTSLARSCVGRIA